MTPLDYEFLRKLLKERSGLDLSADKQYLVESRLIPLARRAGLPGIPELVAKMKGGAEALTSEVVEAMTTNETFFFRDKIPFDHLRETILPALVQARASRRSLRIWCAASSTGQEPYSIAMCVKEFAGACGLAGRDRRDRPVAGGAGEVQGRNLQPVRGAARPADPDAGQVFHADRRAVAAQRRYPRHGAAPAAQPAAGFFPPRHVRRDLLPQRPDLFRPGHQGRHLRSACAGCSSPTACWRWARPNPWSGSPTPSSPIRTGAGSIGSIAERARARRRRRCDAAGAEGGRRRAERDLQDRVRQEPRRVAGDRIFVLADR